MIKIPEVSVFAIDCFTPEKTLKAIEFSTRFVDFAEIIFLTDLDKFQFENNPFHRINPPKIRWVDHKESDRKVARKEAAHNPPLPLDYEMAAMREPFALVNTSHYLRMEWDSAVLNPYAWDRDWLKWDFCGADWPAHHEPGWPPCDGYTNAVGNAGFSLQSKRYAEAIRAATFEFPNDPAIISSDMWPCRTMRPWLEKNYSIKFAPPEVAAKFSCENRIYCSQFGFHGRWTCEMNNWSGRFFSEIRPKQ